MIVQGRFMEVVWALVPALPLALFDMVAQNPLNRVFNRGRRHPLRSPVETRHFVNLPRAQLLATLTTGSHLLLRA
ncbi:hypothetical protein BJX76DRAFT_19564 [Aspergillus varians]